MPLSEKQATEWEIIEHIQQTGLIPKIYRKIQINKKTDNTVH